MIVLVINAGSSSLKYQLLNPQTQEVLAKGVCERIGIDGCLTHRAAGKPEVRKEIPMPSHQQAVSAVLSLLTDSTYGVLRDISQIEAVGHRVVHGGEQFSGSVRIDDKVMAALQTCISLAPLHNPANILGIKACMTVLGPDVPQVGVFDTAFHQTMPAVAYTYALPKQYYEVDGVRRYGFHGTSHRYVAMRAADMLGKPLQKLKLISCHLGNGSSIAAINHGRSVDTSMGFTPLSGLPMGTRSGDLDPGILEYLMQRYHYSIHDMLQVLNKQSGVQGISALSSDFRDLDQAADTGNGAAALAIDKFAYEVRKYIGAYIAVMDGVDAIIFTAGIGENSADMRMNICNSLGCFGVRIDFRKNKARSREIDISSEDSSVRVLVIPTNEELMIAMDTMRIVNGTIKEAAS